MSAVNPLPASGHVQGGHEKRAYEPSMEEILASIRRIIADDQSLPKHPSVEPAGVVTSAASTHQPVPPAPPSPEPTPFPDLRAVTPPAPIPVDVSAPPPQAETIPAPSVEPIAPFPPSDLAAQDFRHEPFEAYESITAPQFPVPHGPVGDESPTRTHAYETAPAMPDFRREEIAEEPIVEEPAAVIEPAPLGASHLTGRTASIDEDDALYDTPIEPPKPRAPQRAGASLFSDATDSSVSSAFNMLAASRLADNSDELLNLAREMIRPLLRTWLDDNLPSMVERMVRAEIERVARGGGGR